MGVVWFGRVLSAALGVVGYVRFLPVRPGGGRIPSCAFGPFNCVLAVVGFVRVLSANSRALWGS